MGDKGDIPWLVPSDYLSIIGMLSFVFGTVLLPLSGVVRTGFARGAFGLGALLWFPTQERIVVLLSILVSILYVYILLRR